MIRSEYLPNELTKHVDFMENMEIAQKFATHVVVGKYSSEMLYSSVSNTAASLLELASIKGKRNVLPLFPWSQFLYILRNSIQNRTPL